MSRFDFAPHFTEREFRCRCGCEILSVDRAFLERLERGRIRADIPFTVTSGCRCPAYNRAEGGKTNSAHVTINVPGGTIKQCYAADVWVTGSRTRGVIIPALVAVGFNRFGLANTFVHVDIDPALPPNMIWFY